MFCSLIKTGHSQPKPYPSTTFLQSNNSWFLASILQKDKHKEMKSMKERLLRKLKIIPSIDRLRQGLVSQLNCTETFPNQNLQNPPVSEQANCKKGYLQELVADSIDVSKHIRELRDEEVESELNICQKEIITSSIQPNDQQPAMDGSSEITAKHHQQVAKEGEQSREESPSLLDFEEKCPPGGSESIIFYTTSFRSIRKIFEDCQTIRFLLESFKVRYYERDVSMHLEFREELWRLLGGRVIPPRLFIKGRYIGGADEVVGLHEQGMLKKLLEGIPPGGLSDRLCTGCGNLLFVVCCNCNGSGKVYADMQKDHEMHIRCPECNENGLTKCPICS